MYIVILIILNELKIIFTHFLFHKMFYFNSSGQDVQRISVVRDLAKLIRENQVEGMRKVVPKVRVSN